MFFPEKRTELRKIRTLLEQSGRVYITSHVNPDGDAIGSEIALFRLCRKAGKPCRILNHSETPLAYRFLDPENSIEVYPLCRVPEELPGGDDMVFFLDISNMARTGDCGTFFASSEAAKVVIDHHQPETIDADIVLNDTSASSTGELVFELVRLIDETALDETTASALFTAIVTDTGFFRYSNTTSRTHEIAAQLYSYGVRAVDVRRHLEVGYPFARQKLLGEVLARTAVSDDGLVAYSSITLDMFGSTGTTREHTDGIIDHIRMIQGIRVAFLVIEETTGVFKVSFRTAESVPADRIAAKLGGGGHPRAAGANVASGSASSVIAQTLEAIETVRATETTHT